MATRVILYVGIFNTPGSTFAWLQVTQCELVGGFSIPNDSNAGMFSLHIDIDREWFNSTDVKTNTSRLLRAEEHHSLVSLGCSGWQLKSLLHRDVQTARGGAASRSFRWSFWWRATIVTRDYTLQAIEWTSWHVGSWVRSHSQDLFGGDRSRLSINVFCFVVWRGLRIAGLIEKTNTRSHAFGIQI